MHELVLTQLSASGRSEILCEMSRKVLTVDHMSMYPL